MRIERADFALGVGAIVLASAYLAVAHTIEDSLLSDAVGAAGAPKLVGWVMAVVGALLALRSLRFARSADSPATADAWPQHRKALGLLALLVATVVVAPFLGYALTIALLTGAVALYAGAPMNWRTVAISIAAGAGFWALFAGAFGIAVPTGLLFGGR